MKFKHSVGEKVLCFEPDETKARVLYNAKIMDADITKDVKGKKYVEYKIHFQGWNHAWDRWADESFVLKDDEQNRKLQKKLARRAFKKLKLQKGRRRHLPGVSNKQESASFVDIDSSSDESMDSDITNTSAKERLSESEDFIMDDGSLPTNNSGRLGLPEILTEETALSRDEYHSRRLVTVDIPPSLKQRLEDDQTMIKRRNMVVNLPIRPNVVQILENYVKKFAIQFVGATEKQRFTVNSTGQPLGPDYILPPDKRLNLCQEICCDLKLLFDYALPLVLLYLPERKQYKHLMKTTTLQKQHTESSSFADLKVHVTADIDSHGEEIVPPHQDEEGDRRFPNTFQQEDMSSSKEVKSSRTLSESSDVQTNQDHPKPKKKNAEAQLIEETHKYLIPNQPNLDQTGLSKDSFGRRRSSRLSHHEPGSPQKTSVGDESRYGLSERSDIRTKESLDNDQSSKYSVRIEPCMFLRAPRLNRHLVSAISSDGSSSSSAIHRKTLYNADPRMDREAYLSASGSDIKNILELKKIWDWCIVSVDFEPDEDTGVPPSHIYGIHHLLRLFVKLPDILTKMEIPEFKLKVIGKHINTLLKFLSEYERELFELDAYIPAAATWRKHPG